MFIGTGFALLIAFSRASEACSAASAALRSVMSTAKVPTALDLALGVEHREADRHHPARIVRRWR